MTIGQSITYLEISQALGITRDRYEHIMSYMAQMTRDYKGDVADIMKEIPLNLKGKERYFMMFIIGRSSSPLFSSVSDEQKGEFITEIIDTLKISPDMAKLITEDIYSNMPKHRKEDINISTIDIMKTVIDGDLKGVEKDYTSFTIGLAHV